MASNGPSSLTIRSLNLEVDSPKVGNATSGGLQGLPGQDWGIDVVGAMWG